MAQLPSVFNAKDNEKMKGFEPIPAGWYLVEAVKSELKDNNAKTGKHLTYQFKVLEGDCKGRLVFVLLNLVHPNQQAVEIAEREHASICEACGLDDIEDSTEVHGIPIAVHVKIKPGSGSYAPKNEIDQYKAEEDMPESEGTEFPDD